MDRDWAEGASEECPGPGHAGVREERRAAQARVMNRIAQGTGGGAPVESVDIQAEGVVNATAGRNEELLAQGYRVTCPAGNGIGSVHRVGNVATGCHCGEEEASPRVVSVGVEQGTVELSWDPSLE